MALVKDKKFLMVVIVLIVAIFLRLLLFVGSFRNDAYRYTKDSVNLSRGILEPVSLHPEIYRFGIICPTALFIKIFGYHYFSTILLSFFCSIGLLIVMYKFTNLLYGHSVGVISLIFLSFLPLDILYATELWPDSSMTFFLLLGVYFCFKFNVTKNWQYMLMSGIFFGIGQTIKETCMFIIPLLAIIYFFLWKQRNLLPIFILLTGFCIGFSWELIFQWIYTGDPLFKYRPIISSWQPRITGPVATCPEKILSLSHILCINIFSTMLLPIHREFFYHGIVYWIAFGSIVFFLIHGQFANIKLLVLWIIIFMVMLNFFPRSLNPYIPATSLYFGPSARYFYPVLIPAIILAALLFYQIYLKLPKILPVFILIFVISIHIFIAYNIRSYAMNFIQGAKATVNIISKSLDTRIYVDKISYAFYQYLTGFSLDNMIIAKDEKPSKGDLVVVNEAFIKQLEMEEAFIPEIFKNPSPRWKIIYQNEFLHRKKLHEMFSKIQQKYKVIIYKVEP